MADDVRQRRISREEDSRRISESERAAKLKAEQELEDKLREQKNYWAFAYAKYCIEQDRKIEEQYRNAYETLKDTYNAILKPKDQDPERIAKGIAIMKAAEEVHKDIKEINDERQKVHEEVEELEKEDNIDVRAKKIRDHIRKYCDKFVTIYDRREVAKDASCLMEYIDAMYASPELAAKVGLNDQQYALAAEMISMGMIIKEGMESLEQEYLDSTSPNPSLTEKQHQINLTKITMMDQLNNRRMQGDLLTRLQNSKMLDDYAKGDHFEIAARMSDPQRRRAMTKALADNAMGKTAPVGRTQNSKAQAGSGSKPQGKNAGKVQGKAQGKPQEKPKDKTGEKTPEVLQRTLKK